MSTIWYCQQCGLISDEDLDYRLSREGGVSLRCPCGRSVEEYDEWQGWFKCWNCGYECTDPEVELHEDSSIVRYCPKCNQPED